jgi:cation transport regulator ChaC
VRGTCLEYLENLAERLQLLGLDDPAIHDLHTRVRRQLEAQTTAA